MISPFYHKFENTVLGSICALSNSRCHNTRVVRRKGDVPFNVAVVSLDEDPALPTYRGLHHTRLCKVLLWSNGGTEKPGPRVCR